MFRFMSMDLRSAPVRPPMFALSELNFALGVEVIAGGITLRVDETLHLPIAEVFIHSRGSRNQFWEIPIPVEVVDELSGPLLKASVRNHKEVVALFSILHDGDLQRLGQDGQGATLMLAGEKNFITALLVAFRTLDGVFSLTVERKADDGTGVTPFYINLRPDRIEVIRTSAE